MALNTSSYVTYVLSQVQPEKKVVALSSHNEWDVRQICMSTDLQPVYETTQAPAPAYVPYLVPPTALPLTWYSGASNAPLAEEDPSEKLLRKFELAFLAANSELPDLDAVVEPTTLEEQLERWDEEYLDEGDDIAADIFAQAVERTIEKIGQRLEAKPTALQLVRRLIITDNPWQILEERRNEILTGAGAADALALLFADATKVRQANRELDGMVQWLLVSARNSLDAYLNIEKCYHEAIDQAKVEVAQLKAALKAAAKQLSPTGTMTVSEDDGIGNWGDENPVDPEEVYATAKVQTPLQAAEAKLRQLYTNRPKHDTGTRPVDVYRLYAKALRVVRKAGYIKAGSILRDILNSTSTPFADMENPDHVNSYTGEIDPEAAEYRIHIAPVTEALLASEQKQIPIVTLANGIRVAVREEETPDYNAVAKDCNWTVDVLETHLSAQEGFSVQPDEEVTEWMNEFGQETTGPMWMQIQHDFASSENYIQIVQEAKAFTQPCRDYVNNNRRVIEEWTKVYLNPGDGKKRVEIIIDVLMKIGAWSNERELRKYLKNIANRKDWDMQRKVFTVAYQAVKWAFRRSQEAAEFLDFLNELVQRGESEVDIALVFLSIQNCWMFTEEAAEQVILSHSIGDASNLYNFIEDNEEEILANLNDRAPKKTTEPWDEIEKVAEEGIQQAISTGNPASSNVRQTPEYIEGYIRAAMTVKMPSFRVGTEYHNALEEAGWSNFRMKRSPKGAELYSQARSRKSTQGEAMKAFWKQYYLEENRKTETKINGTWVDGKDSGLVLSSGRKVSFNIAVLKFNGGEFEHTADEWKKIAAFLRAKKIGGYFCSLIDKKCEIE